MKPSKLLLLCQIFCCLSFSSLLLLLRLFLLKVGSQSQDFANHAADQGLRHSALGARALCGSSGSRKAQKKHLIWGGQAGKSPREPPTRTSIEPETHRGHQEPERRLSWWERTVGFQMYPTNRRKRLDLMCRLLPGWPDNRTSFLLQVTDNVN